MTTKKYELILDDTLTIDGKTLFRIRSLVDIPRHGVVVGTVGGYVESEENLSHSGNAWVFGNAKVFDDAWVFGNAKVFGDAKVYGYARVFGNACVFGNSLVSGNAQVFDYAKVSGDTWVSGNASVFGDTWVSE